jgi:hypothetical protein
MEAIKLTNLKFSEINFEDFKNFYDDYKNKKDSNATFCEDEKVAIDFFNDIEERTDYVLSSGSGWIGCTLMYGNFFKKDENEIFILEKDEDGYIEDISLKEKYENSILEYGKLPCCFPYETNMAFYTGFLIHNFKTHEDEYTHVGNFHYLKKIDESTNVNAKYANIFKDFPSKNESGCSWYRSLFLKNYAMYEIWKKILDEKYKNEIEIFKGFFPEGGEYCLIPSDCAFCT